jgi:nucleobase:cation symporter-1, NCS1 family
VTVGADARVTVEAETAGSGSPGAIRMERRGIEYVPDSERWGTPGALFGMWAGAVWNVEFLVYGALGIALFGLSFPQALLVIIVGNLSYVLTGLTSLQGPQAGTTTFGVSRAPFGPNGNRVPSLFNWFTQVGFEIEGIALIVIAGEAIANHGGVHAGTPLKVGLIAGAVLVQAILPLVGHAAILKVLRLLALPFVAVFAVMAVFAAPKVHLHLASHGAGWGTLMVFLALVVAAGGLGWAENGNDYSRYLPRDAGKTRIVLAVALGAAIPSILCEVLGAAVATGIPAVGYPNGAVLALPNAFPGWFVVPYLVIAICQLFAINTLDLYSSGVTLQSLGLHISRYRCVLVDTVVAGGFTAYVIFSARFNQLLADFLEFIIVWLAPWCAIYLVDWWLRRGRYDSRSLLASRGGLYWRRGGVHWPAIIAQLVGMAASAAWLNAYSPYVSWLSTHAGGSDFSIFTGPAVGGLLYYILAGRTVRAEAEATETENLQEGPLRPAVPG